MENQLVSQDKFLDYNGTKVVSSRTIAEVFEKEHKNVVRDIRIIMNRHDVNEYVYISTYYDSQNRQRLEYLLTEEMVNILITRYLYKTQLKKHEHDYFESLEEALKFYNLNLKRQFYIKPYFVDCCIEEQKLFIEYDEYNHDGYDKQKELERQNYILSKYPGYKFVRLNHLDGDMYNIAKVLHEIKKEGI